MYLIIGADLVPTQSNHSLFARGDAEGLAGGALKECLDGAAYRIFNLETPLTDRAAPVRKHGPHLMAPPDTVSGIRSMGIDLLAMANNHIMDQGAEGLRSTVRALEGAGIAHTGAGETLREAGEPFLFDFGGKRIGVYACAEHEFSIAGERTPGANPFDPLWSLDHVEVLKRRADYVIVLYHGGKEHYRYPSPELRKRCRRLADKGADLVLCQHSHCVGCEERYGNSVIVYGQGNFLFDDCDDEFWRTGLLVKVDGGFGISYVPVVKDGCRTGLADERQAAEILGQFRERSRRITEPGFVEAEYAKLCETALPKYLVSFSGKRGIVFRLFNRLSGNRLLKRSVRRGYDRKRKTALRNYIECEAHRELILGGLREHEHQNDCQRDPEKAAPGR